jgi:ATP-dependent protease ClpP protease subunit
MSFDLAEIKMAAFGEDVDAVAKAKAGTVDREWFSVNMGANGRTPEVRIFGPIGGWFSDVAPEPFAAKLDELIDEPEVRLVINSRGGSVFDAVAIYNIVRAHPARFVGEVRSIAASAASFILQAADWRTMDPASELMVHAASGGAWGSSALMREVADLLDRQTDKVAHIYADRSGSTADYWRDLMGEGDTWYNPTEALSSGLIDEAKGTHDDDDDGDGGEEAETSANVGSESHNGVSAHADDVDPEIPDPALAAATAARLRQAIRQSRRLKLEADAERYRST